MFSTQEPIPPCPPMTIQAGDKTPEVVAWRKKYGHLNQSQTMPPYFFVFDVESIGLHGQGYAVGGCILDASTGERHSSFCLAVDPAGAVGEDSDREWVQANIPAIVVNCATSQVMRDAFWKEWENAQAKFPGITMAAECAWPVEANFLEACIKDNEESRRFKGPYPLHEIASFMAAAGMDPMATYAREYAEEPKHDPLADARQSARLLSEALSKSTK